MTADNWLQDHLDHMRQAVAEHNTMPWRNMRGMRNRIAHGNFDLATPHGTRGHSTHICSGCLSAAAVV